MAGVGSAKAAADGDGLAATVGTGSVFTARDEPQPATASTRLPPTSVAVPRRTRRGVLAPSILVGGAEPSTRVTSVPQDPARPPDRSRLQSFCHIAPILTPAPGTAGTGWSASPVVRALGRGIDRSRGERRLPG